MPVLTPSTKLGKRYKGELLTKAVADYEQIKVVLRYIPMVRSSREEVPLNWMTADTPLFSNSAIQWSSTFSPPSGD